MVKMPKPPHNITALEGFSFASNHRFTKFCGDEDCEWCNRERTVIKIVPRLGGLFGFKLIWREPSQNNPLQKWQH